MISELSIWELIKTTYPVSFIGMVLLFSGYIKAYIILRLHVKSLEKRIEKLSKD